MSEAKESTIGKDFTLPQLFRFVAPPVFTRLMVSLLQTLDDSLFVSRYVGQNALAAFSIAMPWFMLIDAFGMMASAVSVVCSIKMGEKEIEEAKSDFTTMILLTLCIGTCFSLTMHFFMKPILLMLGATELLMPYAVEYMSVSKFYTPLILASYIFGSFYVIAGKPKCSMYASAINTACQFFFDWLFIAKLKIGIVGAAYANLIGNIAITVFAVIFYSNKKHEIHFVKPQSEIWPLVKSVFKYGRMQALTSLAVSLSSYINNHVHLGIGGEEVVAAYTIVSGVFFMFMNSFFGLIGSTSPLASYALGEKNPKKLIRVIKQTLVLLTCLGTLIVCLIIGGRSLILKLYLTETSSQTVKALTDRGLKIYPLSMIFFGYNVYIQDLLNVLGEHKVSMFLSVMENIIIQNIMVILLPRLFGIEAIWFVFIVTEAITFLFTLYFVYHYRDVYGYGKDGIATFTDR
ncbi:MAG: polysaccharide biosynthesis C-terminal domain-containing protein [Erysipelotrichaceae bacterium]|nr:polysaccharide biosynthesis C-terminal domain-containing protein [Erysipelotrichaceae bacterium]